MDGQDLVSWVETSTRRQEGDHVFVLHLWRYFPIWVGALDPEVDRDHVSFRLSVRLAFPFPSLSDVDWGYGTIDAHRSYWTQLAFLSVSFCVRFVPKSTSVTVGSSMAWA